MLALTEAEPLCPVVIVSFSHTHRDRSVVGGGCSCRQTGRGVGAELWARRRVRNASNGSERRFVYRAPLPVRRSALFSSTLVENDNELPVEQIMAQHPSGV